MTRITLIAALVSSAALAQGAFAQQNDVDPARGNGVGMQNTSIAALGSLIAGPYDVETPPFDNRTLGVEEMGGFLWVTGGGHTSLGAVWDYKIHQYSMTGTYIQSFAQVSNALSWGGRDMAADGNKLYLGSDGGEVSEYLWSGGVLTHVALHTVPVPDIVRALCRRPSDGHFFTKSFTGTFREFTLTSLIASVSNSALSAYGFGWDDTNQSIWSTTTGPSVQEVSAGCVFKAGTFGPTWGTAQGGADVYCDSRNPGKLSMVILGQGTPDQLEIFDLAVNGTCGPPGFTLAKTGTCPGPVTLSSSNGTPNRPVAVLYGNAGTFTKPSGACAGLTLGIQNPALAVMLNNNGAGAASVSFNTTAAFCGKTVQFVDVQTCTASNTVTL